MAVVAHMQGLNEDLVKVDATCGAHRRTQNLCKRALDPSQTIKRLGVVGAVAQALAASLDEGGTTTLGGAFTDPGTRDAHTVLIAWGDGDTQSVNLGAGVLSFGQAHQYRDNRPANAPYQIVVTVTDKDDGSASAGQAISVANVAPTISALAGDTLVRGGTYAAAGSFADPGADSWTATVNYGDGTGTQPLSGLWRA